MTSGAKVIVLLLGAVGAVALLAVVAFLLTDEPGVRCVEGELQDNVTAPNGEVRPRIETFSTLEEAESFICRRIPHPRETGNLTLERVRVARHRNLGDTIEGEGGAEIEFEYGPPTSTFLRLAVRFPEVPLPLVGGPDQRGKVQNQDAHISAETGEAAWNKDGFSFAAKANLDSNFTLKQLLAILESVR